MKSLFSKSEWVLWVITLAPSTMVFFMWEQIPQTIPTHYNLAGKADVWGDKGILLWVVPLMTFFMYFLLLFVPLIDPKKRVESMENKYFSLRLILLSFISVISLLWVYTSASKTIGFTTGLFPVIAVFLIVLGNYLQTIKPNYFIGIRTPWTLQNENNWQHTHRLGARVYMIGGALLLFCSLFGGLQGFNSYFLLSLLLILLIPIFYSFFLFTKSQKS